MCDMKMYADQRSRRARQIGADVFFVAWIFFWIWQGVSTHDSTMELRTPTDRTSAAATNLGDNLRDAADALVDLPLVGDAASAPFSKAADNADKLADASASGRESITVLARKFGSSLAIAPTAILAGFYLPVRVRFIRESTQARNFMASSRDLDLFALRGLTTQPVDALLRLSNDPAGAWRAGDPAFVQALAGLELQRCGITPPFPNPMAAVDGTGDVPAPGMTGGPPSQA